MLDAGYWIKRQNQVSSIKIEGEAQETAEGKDKAHRKKGEEFRAY